MSEVTTVVQSVHDAINDVTATIAAGEIQRILVKRINEDGSPRVTTFKDKKTGQQKSINNTHRYSLLLKNGEDQSWISFGEGEVKNLKYEDKFQIKTDDGYVDLKEGMKIRLPVTTDTFQKKDGTQGSSVNGKKNKIKITDKSGARESSQPQPQRPQNNSQSTSASGAKTTKVYGEIVSVNVKEATVKLENGDSTTVVLTDDQLGQVQVGGRLAGQRADDGTLSNFKAYGPAGSGSASNGKRDNSGVEIGHAINGALNIHRSGLQAPVVEIAKIVHDVTRTLKVEITKDPAHKGLSEYDAGAMVGHAVLNASRDIQVYAEDGPDVIKDRLFNYSRTLIAEVVPGVTAYVKGDNLQTAASSQPEPNLKGNTEEAPEPVNTNGHVDYSQPPMDFDDSDIPFASLGLQYPTHAMHSLF